MDIRKYFSSQRVVNTWNSLPQIVVDADSVNLFNNRLDEFDKYFIDVYIVSNIFIDVYIYCLYVLMLINNK